MNPDLSAIVVAALGFVVALVMAKVVSHRVRQRKLKTRQQAQQASQSRQVRRARERQRR
jgi:predicted histidine transporter YuiF (NhaC family)